MSPTKSHRKIAAPFLRHAELVSLSLDVISHTLDPDYRIILNRADEFAVCSSEPNETELCYYRLSSRKTYGPDDCFVSRL